ncbi:MAG TPA: hypothetical protein VJJ82_05320 [Candidatus Nanoarchaeia archaeon]|nr:hypothetical protein [Candidatus Nanoarchaeia archaeon]
MSEFIIQKVKEISDLVAARGDLKSEPTYRYYIVASFSAGPLEIERTEVVDEGVRTCLFYNRELVFWGHADDGSSSMNLKKYVAGEWETKIAEVYCCLEALPARPNTPPEQNVSLQEVDDDCPF